VVGRDLPTAERREAVAAFSFVVVLVVVLVVVFVVIEVVVGIGVVVVVVREQRVGGEVRTHLSALERRLATHEMAAKQTEKRIDITMRFARL
jgi:hypothetical protein